MTVSKTVFFNSPGKHPLSQKETCSRRWWASMCTALCRGAQFSVHLTRSLAWSVPDEYVESFCFQFHDYCCRAHAVASQHRNSFEQVRNVVLGYCELVGCSNPVHANPSGQVHGTPRTDDIPDGRFSVIVPVNMPWRHRAPRQRRLSTLRPMYR
jgi:hypothetical protein